MRLILVRHGQTDWNKEYRVQGHTDLPLNAVGRAQAQAIAGALERREVEAIYSSPLQRAFETAEAIDRFHGVGVTAAGGLKELNVGELDGLYYPDLKVKSPDFFEVWTTDAASAKFPGGESLPELQERVWQSVQDIVERDHKKTVVVTSHFFALLSLLCKVLDLGLSEFRRLSISVASISELEISDGKMRLVCFNETCHLK